MTIITNNFRVNNTQDFVKSLDVNNYYVFASHLTRTESQRTNSSTNSFFEKTLFGKKVTKENVKYLLTDRKYIGNTVYDMYDDTMDMTNKNFYVVVYPDSVDSGFYHIYKCLFNNYGSPSIQAPIYVDGIYQYKLSDGYIWQYMFSLNSAEFKLYKTTTKIPYIENQAVKNNASDGIDVILVENRNTNVGYDSIKGIITGIANGNEITLALTESSLLKKTTNYYVRHDAFITQSAPNVETKKYEIIGSSYDSSLNTVTITLLNVDSFIQENKTIEILPRVTIRGSGTGAIAKSFVDVNSKRITKIDVINKGIGYTNAEVSVLSPIGFETLNNVAAQARAIIPPKNGHGNNVIEELYATNVLVTTEFTSRTNDAIPDTNFYSKVGLVKNPSFDLIEKQVTTTVSCGNVIELDDVSGLELGYLVETNTKVIKGTTITSIDTINNTITLSGMSPVFDTILAGESLFFSENLAVFDNRIELIVSNPQNYAKNDIVFQSLEENEIAGGVVHEVTENSIFVTDFIRNYNIETNRKSSFRTNLSLRKRLPDNNFEVYPSPTQIIEPKYIQKSGNLLYFTDFDPVERKDDSLEQIKIILVF